MWGSGRALCGTGRRNPSVVSRGGEHRNDRSGKKERKGLIVQSLEINLLRKSRETAFVESRLDVAVAHGFQIDHGRCDIAVSHPLLQRADLVCRLLLEKKKEGYYRILLSVGTVGD